MNKVPVYLVFGPQGSGKSTQAEYLSNHLKLPFFDSGKELRDIVEKHSDNWQEIRKIMLSGQLVPNNILRAIFDRFLASHDCSNGLVIDGFPRTRKQGELLEELSDENHWQLVVFYVEISDQTAKERLSRRHQIVNGKKTIREDDQPNIVEQRLKVFKKETLPVIHWLRSISTYYRIDGEPSREKVFSDIKEKING